MTVLAYTKEFLDRHCTMNVCIDPFNKRVRIDDIRGDLMKGLEKAEEIAKELKLEKLIVKGRKEQFMLLLERGFQAEAAIDKYFLGSDCYFFCKYFSIERSNNEQLLKENEILKNVQQLERIGLTNDHPKQYELKLIEKDDAEKLAVLYQQVFKIYPTPLHDPEYIKKTIEEGTIYYAFQVGNEIVSAASAEVNTFYKNAEMTDCATLPQHRKHGLMKILLEKLEDRLVEDGVYCSYSIARALSFGMNSALHGLGYQYRGRLTNNVFIYDKLENMNVWVKDLSRS
ncbi:putative beta-lysine N-acetyltransferase [Bacillus dakarensis]|uniref:putative beta-lysine N-acetyltransferase n=1 Tax=Robertmurraya dakarensis TaxID=1926278 RepID=UPI00098195FE|nr:putative beta-lysine N-acetyltransferase [Bacillus dakarensis]